MICLPLYEELLKMLSLSFIQLFGHDKVSVLDGGLEKWTGDGFETTNMMLKKAVRYITIL